MLSQKKKKKKAINFNKELRRIKTKILQGGYLVNPLSANHTKYSNTLKEFVGKLPTNCLSVFDHFVKLALKGLSSLMTLFSDSTKKKKDC